MHAVTELVSHALGDRAARRRVEYHVPALRIVELPRIRLRRCIDDVQPALGCERVVVLPTLLQPEHVLAPGDIPLVKSDRGGQVTYHGPGQLVIYTLLDIKRLNIGVRELVSRIESSIIDLLGFYDIAAVARADAPGVYVDGRKIASLGLRIRNGRSYHGLSLNVEMDLTPFNRINPCGYAGMQMAQLKDFDNGEPIEQAAARLVQRLQQSFGYSDLMVEYSEGL